MQQENLNLENPSGGVDFLLLAVLQSVIRIAAQCQLLTASWFYFALCVFARGIFFPILKPNGMTNRMISIKIFAPRRKVGKEKVFLSGNLAPFALWSIDLNAGRV